MNSINHLQSWLRRQPMWLTFQETNREGWRQAWQRTWFQRKILDTPPMRTAREGPVEVRALTWRRDWMNLLWALKGFYHFAGVDYPLYIHDGGLLPAQAEQIQAHFPDATIVGREDGDTRINAELQRRGLTQCLAYRPRNASARKLFDFFAFSQADYLICIDSDIVFFRRPDLLIVPPEGVTKNRYNRDCEFWYSMSVDELEASFGLRPPPLINSGLALVRRTSIDFDAINRWLTEPKLFENKWVTEQTLHALCSTAYGVELLPDSYKVDTKPGLTPEIICKHYPGFFRSGLYTEGMARLIASGFLDDLRARAV
jgi:hypothetical protein